MHEADQNRGKTSRGKDKEPFGYQNKPVVEEGEPLGLEVHYPFPTSRNTCKSADISLSV